MYLSSGLGGLKVKVPLVESADAFSCGLFWCVCGVVGLFCGSAGGFWMFLRSVVWVDQQPSQGVALPGAWGCWGSGFVYLWYALIKTSLRVFFRRLGAMW